VAARAGAVQARSDSTADLGKGAGDDVSQYCATNGDGGYDDDGQNDVFQGGHAALIVPEGLKQFAHEVFLAAKKFEDSVVVAVTRSVGQQVTKVPVACPILFRTPRTSSVVTRELG
jgi:hypothetical protein